MNKNSSLILGLMLSTAIVMPAMAETITVGTTTELKNAIANSQASEIVLSKDLSNGLFFNKNNPLKQSNITINGQGHKLTLSGYGFGVSEDKTAQNITFKDVTLAGLSSRNPLVAALGGAEGKTLNFVDSTISKNKTTNSSNAAVIQMDASSGSINTINATNSEFSENHSSNIGVIGSFGQATITSSVFKGNYTDKEADQNNAGAIFLGSSSITDIQETEFDGNKSKASAGAIGSRAFKSGNNSAAKLDISNATFSSNEAQTTGGAIDNYLYGSKGKSGSAYVSDSTFTSNSAKDGGAIFNHIGKDGEILNAGAKQVGNIYLNNATFTSNTASSKGGAIYNEGILSLAGTSTFTGNKAGGAANDIYNEGTVNIDGEYKTDGGIVNNDAGSVVFASSSKFNAALENGTAYIQGGTVTGSTNLVIDNSVSESWIQMFDKAQTFSLTNSLYDITEDEGTAGKYNIGKKSADEVVENLEEQGVSESAAQTIAAVAQSTSDHEAIKAISEAVQTGDVKAAEQAAEELAPSKANEVLSIATSINKMIYQAVENRLMALGRSSGDLLKGGAFWVQGLYNQAKQDTSSRVEGFSADSSGVSFGFDAELTDALTIGLGYGHTKTDASTDTRDIDVDGDNVFVYGKYQPSQWYVNTMLSYGNARYSEKKAPAGVKMKANYDVNTYAANIMAGYEYANGFTPEAGLRYLYARQNDYKDGAQRVKTDSNDVLTAVLGAKYERVVETKRLTLKPSVKVAATYDVMSDNSKAHVAILGGGNYQVQGKRLHRFGVETTLGLGTSYNNWDFDVQYVGAFREDFHSNTILGKIKYNF